MIALVADLDCSQARCELEEERIYGASAVAEIRAQPRLLLRKLVVAGSTFWYIGENRSKTLVLSVLRLPILLLAAAGVWQSVRTRQRKVWPALVIVAVYWAAHLPFAPPGRLSVVVMPVLLAFAASSLLRLVPQVWDSEDARHLTNVE